MNYYNVAGHSFGVSGSAEIFALMDNYEPFLASPSGADSVFMLTVTEGQAVSYIEDLRQEEEGQQIICGQTAAHEPVYEFIWQIMGSVLLIILPTFELLQTKHQLVLTVVGFLPPKRA